ncbi:MAG: hypothetical protein ACTSQZ_04870 [Candidatus Thorarchaeota archaeon]
MTDDTSPLDRLREACRKRCDELEEEEVISEMANAIGDRRLRDLVDITAETEIQQGWKTTAHYLIKSFNETYPAPLGSGLPRTKIEPLKYREMIFSLLGCSGFEPVKEETHKLLTRLSKEKSSIHASQALTKRVEKDLRKQIKKGDSLFFDITRIDSTFSDDIRQKIEYEQNKAITQVKLVIDNNLVDIKPLWYTEYGRKALSELGITESRIALQHFEIVLSVLQVSQETRTTLFESLQSSERKIKYVESANEEYRKLLEYTMNHDHAGLRHSASKHSVEHLNTLLSRSLMKYNQIRSSKNYRDLLSTIATFVTIRTIDSIISLQRLTIQKDPRIATPIAMALGNFYHESSASVLVELLCNSSKTEVQTAAFNALLNLSKKCPELKIVVASALKSDCRNVVLLLRLFKRINHKPP